MPIGVYLCPPEHIHTFWPEVAILIQPAIDRSGERCDSDQLLGLAVSGLIQVWLMVDKATMVLEAACISELRPYTGSHPRLHVMLVGGKYMSLWLKDLVFNLKAFAAHNGAKSLEVYGRLGWERALRQEGFKCPKVRLMELPIE